MSKHYTKKEARFQVEFRPSEQATAHGGQLAVNALFRQFGLWQRIHQASALEVRRHKGKGYDPVPQLLSENRSLWDPASSYLYTDSASSAGKYLEAIAQYFGASSVSYNKWVEPLEKKAQELPETQWSAVEKTQWRDGAEHQAQYGWVRYQPGGCASPKLFAVVRHKSLAGDFGG